MTHEPDITEIPGSLCMLNWKRMDPTREWNDGHVLLVAVPVRHNPERELWRYEFDVVTIECDEGLFRVKCADEPWGWDLHDVDYYVEIRR